MALGSKASEERRRKRREQQKLEQQRGMNDAEREYANAMAALSPTEHDRRIFMIEAYKFSSRLAREPADFALRNVIRIAKGLPLLPYRVAVRERGQTRGIRGGLRADHENRAFPVKFPDDDLY